MLMRAIGKDKLPIVDHLELATVCDHINARHRLAKTASLESAEWFRTIYFRNNVSTEDVVISSMREKTFLVYLPRFRMSGHVHLLTRSDGVEGAGGNVVIPEKDRHLIGTTPESSLRLKYDEADMKMVTTMMRGKELASLIHPSSFSVIGKTRSWSMTFHSAFCSTGTCLTILKCVSASTSRVPTVPALVSPWRAFLRHLHDPPRILR